MSEPTSGGTPKPPARMKERKVARDRELYFATCAVCLFTASATTYDGAGRALLTHTAIHFPGATLEDI